MDADDDEKLLEKRLAAAQRRGLLQCKCPLLTESGHRPMSNRLSNLGVAKIAKSDHCATKAAYLNMKGLWDV